MDVLASDEFGEWLDGLSAQDRQTVRNAVGKLAAMGMTLPFPHSSAITGSSIALRELRCKAGNSPLRVLYAFDPDRDAVLLIGGSKAGDPRLYERLIPVAERIFARYLKGD